MLYRYIKTDSEYNKILRAVLGEVSAQKKRPLFISGLCSGASDALLLSLYEDLLSEFKTPQIVFCGNEKDCSRATSLFRSVGLNVPYYRQRDFVFNNVSSSHTDECERISILHALINGKIDGVVTTPGAFLQYTIPKEKLVEYTVELSLGLEYDIEALTDQLLYMGYARVDMVDSVGQFSRRGDIIDIFSHGFGSEESAVRLEFFGEEIDRVGRLDINTQRVSENISTVTILPVREILYGEKEKEEIKKAISDILKKEKDEHVKKTLMGEMSALSLFDVPFADKYYSLVYPKAASLCDYFDGACSSFVCSSASVKSQLDAFLKMQNENVENLLQERSVLPRYAKYAFLDEVYERFMLSHPCIHLDSFLSGASYSNMSLIFGLRTKQSGDSNNIDLLLEDIENYIRARYKIIVGVNSATEAENIARILREKEIPAIECFLGIREDIQPRAVYITKAAYSEGYELTAAKYVYIGALSKSSDRKSRLVSAKRKRFSQGKKITSYADLSEGDYVVHESYGIGLYKGLTKITSADGVTGEFITIQYAGSDKLFLPAHRIEKISKYIGAHSDDGMLKLSKMGGAEWHKQTGKAKASVKKMAKELIELYARRMRKSGFAYPADDAMQREFEQSFPYEETQSQLDAIEAIKNDMTRAVPMDRLLCGDVGYGKTEVALRAAFKAVEAGKQVALLCPTTILAYQHYQTALSRFAPFPVRVDMISRFRSAKEQKEILRRLKRGDIDIIIGTHKLVYGDVEFKDLGLLIIDEEQRFGVAQKEKLKKFATDIDVLSLSATPIPRTLNMAMGGIRDMSVLDEVPGERMPVQTYVLEYDANIIDEAIRRELARGGQVFYLYNKVDSINDVAARIASSIEGVNVAVAHGQMDKSEIEAIWQQLVDGTIDVLVCTSIIETGIDVANANTLIIENADRLGLSQLHQLRGRVGRSSRRAYAYFTYREGKVLTEIAEKRLRAIREYAQFGAGFKVALRDLEIRGAGNMLGAEQHGHLDAVGYDMYIKLLNEAVLEEKGEKIPERCECKISLKISAFIPDTYIASTAMRMEQYKRIALILGREDREDLSDELCDRYGEYGIEVENLLKIAELKAKCESVMIEKISEEDGSINIYPKTVRIETWSMLDFASNECKMRINLSQNPHLTFKIPKKMSSIDAAMMVIDAYFQKCSQTDNQNNT